MQILRVLLGMRKPPGPIVFAAYLMLSCLAVTPIAFKHLDRPELRRLNSVGFAIAGLFGIIQVDVMCALAPHAVLIAVLVQPELDLFSSTVTVAVDSYSISTIVSLLESRPCWLC